jgi:hypothetical protein
MSRLVTRILFANGLKREQGSLEALTVFPHGSLEFGSEATNPPPPKKNYYYDENYSWQKVFGHGRDEAFMNIKGEILQIIDYSEKGHFRRIDTLHLTQFVKWKIAYLYSGERLIPIFNNDILAKIAADFGISGNRPYPEIQDEMIARKPVHITTHQYMLKLCDKFGGGAKEKAESGKRIRRTTRQAAAEKNIGTQTRRGAGTYVATPKHNILQEALKHKLIEKYGKENVLMEENNVDIKVLQPKKIYFYEVKSSAYASDCIREALGQILSYAYIDSDSRPKSLSPKFGPLAACLT